jgi:hypothetical protein
MEFHLKKRYFLNRYGKGKIGENHLILESIFGKRRMEIRIYNGILIPYYRWI